MNVEETTKPFMRNCQRPESSDQFIEYLPKDLERLK
jgi:hypothetical protein